MTSTGTKIKIGSMHHRGKARIALRFPYDEDMIQRMKTIPGTRWSAKKSGISNKLKINMLRHRDATLLLKLGTDIRYIQEALGHESIRTTEVYTHVAKDRKPASPLDNLEI